VYHLHIQYKGGHIPRLSRLTCACHKSSNTVVIVMALVYSHCLYELVFHKCYLRLLQSALKLQPGQVFLFSNFIIWPLTSICDLDLVGRDLIIICDTSVHDSKQLCQVNLNALITKEAAARTGLFLSQVWPLTSISDLDLEGRALVFVCDTLAYDSEQLCLVIWKSFNQQGSYSPDKVGRTDGWTDSHTLDRHKDGYVSHSSQRAWQ